MNQAAKRAIKSLVLDLRHKLEDDITIQLKRYGFAGERWLPLSRLPHIEEDNQATIERFHLEAALEQHLRRIGADLSGASAKQRAEAVEWFVREVAFTHLNRLVALKCLEVRELIPDIITIRDAYGGRSRAHRDYRNAHPEKARQPDEALPAAIRHACRQVYTEFKFLFDVGDPAVDREPPANTILWPSVPALKECIALINGLDYEAKNEGRTLWAEDEIIGWIYQFYNVEEKESIRDRGRPRRPAEVAVINQFFTPRWIVKFLVDNTLGRLWLEMHPDSERVRKKCDHLVPEPLGAKESGRRGDKETRGHGDEGFELDPESPINNPEAEPRRERKTPQELRLIDPACGTMHFGHYAFEVFQEIYRDAIERGWAEAPEESVAASILRHNLHGVDIDLRAVQLAGLSLFIKAKSADPEAHISHLNLVVADAVLPADGARKRFLDQYADDQVVQDAVRQVLEEMENVAEVGSLLRVEERLRDILGKAGHATVASWDADRQRDFPGFKPQTRQLSLAETAGAKPEEWGAHYTVARLIEDLQEFAAQALQTHDLNAQLFAQEVEKTVHLLDVFLNDYDAVVMNPPYGYTTKKAESYLRKAYPRTWKNLLSCFGKRASLDLCVEGYVGAIVDRSFLLKSSYEDFRRDIILANQLVALADLGWGVLDDAQVETAAFVTGDADFPGNQAHPSVFLPAATSKRMKDLCDPLAHYLFSEVGKSVFLGSADSFKRYPNAALAYWVPESVRRLFSRHDAIHPSFAVITRGIQPGNVRRFIRHFWEVHPESIGKGKKWVLLANGGKFSPFYRTVTEVVLYENNGHEIRHLIDDQGVRRSRTTGEEFYFQGGITWGKRTEILSVQRLEEDHIFTNEGQGIFPNEQTDLWPLIGTLNSKLFQATINALCGQHKTSGYMRLLPYKRPASEEARPVSISAHQGFLLKLHWDYGNEVSPHFSVPYLVQIEEAAHERIHNIAGGIDRILALLDSDASRIAMRESITLGALLDAALATEKAADLRLQSLQAEIDKRVYDIYGLSQRDRRLIERELADRPPELVWPEMEGKSDEKKRREHVRRLISFFLLQALKEKRDGILPLKDGAGTTTALTEVRRQMADTFGEEAAFKMESEIKEILGRDIADWLDGPFIKWHTKLYKRRPIIWQLSSDDYHNTFNCFVYYHALDADTLRKVQTQYLWPQRRATQSRLESAQQDQREGVTGASSRVEDAEEDLEVLEAFEEKLLSVIGGKAPYTPPDWAEGPIRNGVYDPVLDDGVKVNIMPLQKARILRYKRLV